MEHARPPAELKLEGGPANRADAWRKWSKQFKIFLKASGVQNESADVQASLLINLIGPEGYDVYSTFKFATEEEKDKLDVIYSKFDAHFTSKTKTTMMVRFKFFTRNQETGESIDEYVTAALRLLSQHCEFETLEDSLIKDRIVCGIIENTVRDRLLRTDDLTLESAVKICQAHEICREENREIAVTKSSGGRRDDVYFRLGTENNPTPVQDLIKEINNTIRPYQQTIKITNDELTNEEVVIFLSLGYDDATKAQGVFNATELEFFRVLIEQIVTTETRQVTGIHAINLVRQMKSSFTKTEAQKLLNTWCNMRYLDKDENNYALGVRAIHEFEGYLRQNMPDVIEECCLCKQIVFRGCNCPGCGLAVHTRCLNRYLERVEKWPCCKIDFSVDQLERLNSETSRLTQSQLELPPPEESTVEPTVLLEESQDTEGTQEQELIPEISQRVNRKRKRD